MLQKNEGVDIIQEIGGVRDVESALACFENAMDSAHFKRIQKITHPGVLLKIANAIAMCQPDDVFVNTGSEADRQFIRDLALEKGDYEACLTHYFDINILAK